MKKIIALLLIVLLVLAITMIAPIGTANATPPAPITFTTSTPPAVDEDGYPEDCGASEFLALFQSVLPPAEWEQFLIIWNEIAWRFDHWDRISIQTIDSTGYPVDGATVWIGYLNGEGGFEPIPNIPPVFTSMDGHGSHGMAGISIRDACFTAGYHAVKIQYFDGKVLHEVSGPADSIFQNETRDYKTQFVLEGITIPH